jgi:hypothetical protein
MAEKSVLIVDNERSVLPALRMMFGRKYTVLAAERGSEALSLLKA